MMTMKEACEYVKNSRIEQARKHRIEVTQGDLCSGLTESEYNKVRTKVKGAGSRGRKHSHTKLWSHYNVPIEKFTN